MSADERELRDHPGADAPRAPPQPVPVAAVFSAFLKLGVSAFGGPIAGVNAAVVGLLGAALYNPIGTSSVRSAADPAIARVGFGLLVAWEIPALIVLTRCVIASIAMALLF